MDDIIAGDDTGRGMLQRWGALQRAIICQWQAGAWLLLFVSLLALVVGMSPHNLLSIALLLASLAAGPFAMAALTGSHQPRDCLAGSMSASDSNRFRSSSLG